MKKIVSIAMVALIALAVMTPLHSAQAGWKKDCPHGKLCK
jgi:hypothetical protein